jgi:hypothetical protein
MVQLKDLDKICKQYKNERDKYTEKYSKLESLHIKLNGEVDTLKFK